MPKKGKAQEERAAGAASADAASHDPDAWLRDLTDEERKRAMRSGCKSPAAWEIEKKKQKDRDEKAVRSQQQDREASEWKAYRENQRMRGQREANWEAKKWQKAVEKARQRGFKEGILECQEDEYGYWWVELPGEIWKEVQGQYFCTLCANHLNDSSLEAHLNSDKHMRKLAAAVAPSSGNAAPPEPYCAMVPWDPADPASELCKKCLLCDKWVNDDTSHSGTHKAPSGSRDHERRLRNWPFYAENVIKERLRHHPG